MIIIMSILLCFDWLQYFFDDSWNDKVWSLFCAFYDFTKV